MAWQDIAQAIVDEERAPGLSQFDNVVGQSYQWWGKKALYAQRGNFGEGRPADGDTRPVRIIVVNSIGRTLGAAVVSLSDYQSRPTEREKEVSWACEKAGIDVTS